MRNLMAARIIDQSVLTDKEETDLLRGYTSWSLHSWWMGLEGIFEESKESVCCKALVGIQNRK